MRGVLAAAAGAVAMAVFAPGAQALEVTKTVAGKTLTASCDLDWPTCEITYAKAEVIAGNGGACESYDTSTGYESSCRSGVFTQYVDLGEACVGGRDVTTSEGGTDYRDCTTEGSVGRLASVTEQCTLSSNSDLGESENSCETTVAVQEEAVATCTYPDPQVDPTGVVLAACWPE